VAYLPNSSAAAHRLRLVNVSSRFFDPYTFPLGRVSCELHQQHQNPAKRQYQNIKRLCNTILVCSGALAYTWLLCLMYV
jgi:hypothetical protein